MTEETLKAYRARYPRAMKLIDKREEFLVVKCDEPYALDVMEMIRAHELEKGTWTDEDDQWAMKHVPGFPKYLRTDIKNCARCGGIHDNLPFIKLIRSQNEWTHWSPCPNTHQPIMMAIEKE